MIILKEIKDTFPRRPTATQIMEIQMHWLICTGNKLPPPSLSSVRNCVIEGRGNAALCGVVIEYFYKNKI